MYIDNYLKKLAMRVSKRTGVYARDCERLVTVLFEEIVKDIKSGLPVRIIRFGKFEQTVQFSRDVHDPVNGGTKHVPPKTNIKFTPCSDLKYGVRALDWHDYVTEDQMKKDWYIKEIKRGEESGGNNS
jgi:nucleoid DNA-binding protein